MHAPRFSAGGCLEREVELGPVRLRLRDWPGRRGPLVHVADDPPYDVESPEGRRPLADGPPQRANRPGEPRARAAEEHAPRVTASSGPDDLAARIARVIVPEWRVVSLAPRTNVPYQVQALDLLGVLDQFGFLDQEPVLLGEGLGALATLLLAAWQPPGIAGLVRVEPRYTAATAKGLAGRALRDCPPDIAALRTSVQCPVLDLQAGWDTATLQAFLTTC